MNKNFDILESIEIAMDAELKASEFYQNSVEKVTSERGKDLLQQLSDFEQNHYNRLNELKKSLTEKGEFIEYEGTEFSSSKKFSSEVSGKIESNKDEVVNILIMAIDAETKAYEHYRKMADETDNPKGKKMFLKLADEETSHRRILSDEFYHINNQGGLWVWGD